MFQKIIFLCLILGLSFFLYLLKTGDISQEAFNVNKLRAPIHFEVEDSVSKEDISNKLSEIKLVARGVKYTVYTFGGTKFTHLTRLEYLDNRYNVPSEASDALTAVWLGTRYNFYVIEEKKDKDVIYRIYKAAYPTDNVKELEYVEIKTIQDISGVNRSNDLLY